MKQPAEREERLAELVAHIREDDTTSYKPFSTAEELGAHRADLAILLAERFDASRSRGAATDPRTARADDAADHLPSPPDEGSARDRSRHAAQGWAATTPTGSSPSSARAGSEDPSRRSRPHGSPAPVRPGHLRGPRARPRTRGVLPAVARSSACATTSACRPSSGSRSRARGEGTSSWWTTSSR